MMKLYQLALLLAEACQVAVATLQIVPNYGWSADNGAFVHAHGAGIVVENGTYFLIGEAETTNLTYFNAINCYSSQDLVRWHYVGPLLSKTSSGELGPNRVVQRPRVVYNEQTGKYVMWLHIDNKDLSEGKVGYATSDSVCGKYTYGESFNAAGLKATDIGLYKDDSGWTFLLVDDRSSGLQMLLLNDDYTDVLGTIMSWPDKIQAPAMTKIAGRYWVFGSPVTNSLPNDNVYTSSASLNSGWTTWTNFADKGANTYGGHTTFILPYGDSGNVLYMGDSWDSYGNHYYTWLPLTISGSTATMKDKASWVPNAAGGKWADKPAETRYVGEDGSYSNGARTVSCAKCAGEKAAGNLGGSSNGKVTFNNINVDQAVDTTIRVRYLNGDSASRFVKARVNGADAGTIELRPIEWPNAGGAVFHAKLKTTGNSISFEGPGDGRWAADIDEFFVPKY